MCKYADDSEAFSLSLISLLGVVFLYPTASWTPQRRPLCVPISALAVCPPVAQATELSRLACSWSLFFLATSFLGPPFHHAIVCLDCGRTSHSFQHVLSYK